MATPVSSRVRIQEEEGINVKGPAVEVVVGGVESFTVHESFLRPSSPFFDRMLSGNWLEAARRRVELPDDQPKIFAIYVAWLYQKRIPTIPTRRGGWADLFGLTEFLPLVQAYIFGDKIQAKSFQNTIIDAISEKNQDNTKMGNSWLPEIPDCECINIAYENTLPGSPLRRLLVDLWALSTAAENHLDALLPDQFLKDMIRRLRSIAKDQLVRTCSIEPSQYHLEL